MWRHDTSTPHRPQSNGEDERVVGRAVDGTRAILHASGFGHHWWDDAPITYCFARNITDMIRNGKTAYELRHGVPFHGYRIPFGALIRYMPESKRKEGEPSGSKLRKFDPRTKKGIFMGYHVPPGGKWKGDYRVLDLEACAKQKVPTMSSLFE